MEKFKAKRKFPLRRKGFGPSETLRFIGSPLSVDDDGRVNQVTGSSPASRTLSFVTNRSSVVAFMLVIWSRSKEKVDLFATF